MSYYSFNVPSSNPKLSTEIRTMLETAHERVKTKLAEMRKDKTIDKNKITKDESVQNKETPVVNSQKINIPVMKPKEAAKNTGNMKP